MKYALLLFTLFYANQTFAAGKYTPVKAILDKGAMYKQYVYYPKEIKTLGTRPLVVISHGNGHSYTYYTYLQEFLSSHGYIVMSHYNNTGPGIETASQTTLENTDKLLEFLVEVDKGVLTGKVDTTKIAWIGHSRGAEGVVRAYTKLKKKIYTPKFFTIDSIKIISSIAPTTFLLAYEVDPSDVTYHMFVGGADGDVSGAPSPIYMSMPIYERAIGEKFMTYVQGAGHNVFNDSSWDEGDGPDRLARTDVHLVAKSTYLALFDTYLDGSTAWKKYLTNSWGYLRPPGITSTIKISNEYKPALADTNHLVIDDFQTNKLAALASSASVVSYTVSNVSEGEMQDRDSSFGYVKTDTMNGMTRYIDGTNIPQGVVFDWSGAEYNYKYTLDSTVADFSGYSDLTFRAAQISRHPYTVALNDNVEFEVVLKDTKGQSAALKSKDFGSVLTPYARDGGWANEFNTIRMPLSEFEKKNVLLDVSRVESLSFVFGSKVGSKQGRVALDDIELEK